MSEPAETVGQRVARLRDARGWKQSDLARELGVSRTYVKNIEDGAFKPGLDRLRLIAETFGVTTDQLLGEAPLPAAPRALPGTEALPPAFARVVQRLGKDLTPGQWETAAIFLEWLARQGPPRVDPPADEPPMAYGAQAPQEGDVDNPNQGHKTA